MLLLSEINYFTRGEWRMNYFMETTNTRIYLSILKHIRGYRKFIWPYIQVAVWNGIIIEQEYIPVGCVLSAVVAVAGVWWVCWCLSGGWGVCLEGCQPRGCLPNGGSARGMYTSPNPVIRITDRCKNITFPQLCLRTVKIQLKAVQWKLKRHSSFSQTILSFLSKVKVWSQEAPGSILTRVNIFC